MLVKKKLEPMFNGITFYILSSSNEPKTEVLKQFKTKKFYKNLDYNFEEDKSDFTFVDGLG
jgi:hypothetical protein